jgi:hypothetical protein
LVPMVAAMLIRRDARCERDTRAEHPLPRCSRSGPEPAPGGRARASPSGTSPSSGGTTRTTGSGRPSHPRGHRQPGAVPHRPGPVQHQTGPDHQDADQGAALRALGSPCTAISAVGECRVRGPTGRPTTGSCSPTSTPGATSSTRSTSTSGRRRSRRAWTRGSACCSTTSTSTARVPRWRVRPSRTRRSRSGTPTSDPRSPTATGESATTRALLDDEDTVTLAAGWIAEVQRERKGLERQLGRQSPCTTTLLGRSPCSRTPVGYKLVSEGRARP